MDAIYGASLGDVNHDGYLDYAVAGHPREFSTAHRAALLLGGPSGFQPPTYLATRESIADTAVADITLDGNPDIVCDDGVIFPGHGDGTFGAPELFEWFAPDIHVGSISTATACPTWCSPYSRGSVQIIANERRDDNTAPAVDVGPDPHVRVQAPEFADKNESGVLGARHRRGNAQADVPLDVSGRACPRHGHVPISRVPILNPGRYEFFVEVSDGRDGTGGTPSSSP